MQPQQCQCQASDLGIGGNDVSCLELDQVSHHQLADLKCRPLPVPLDQCRGCREFLAFDMTVQRVDHCKLCNLLRHIENSQCCGYRQYLQLFYGVPGIAVRVPVANLLHKSKFVLLTGKTMTGKTIATQALTSRPKQPDSAQKSAVQSWHSPGLHSLGLRC